MNLYACIFSIIAFSGLSFSPDTCSGDPVGLSDLNGRELTPAKYSSIRHFGHGLYFARSINAENKYFLGDERFLLNGRGREFKITVPADSTFHEIFWFGAKADADENAVFEQPPQDMLLVFKSKKGSLGVCNVNGKVVLDAEYSTINPASEGIAFLARREAHAETKRPQIVTFDLKTKQLTPIDDYVSDPHSLILKEGLTVYRGIDKSLGYMDKNGKIVIAPRYEYASSFSEGLALVTVNSSPYVRRDSYLFTVPNSRPAQRDTHKLLIDKRGEIVSPPDLEIKYFQNGFGVASRRSDPAKFGIIDKNFKFVVEPKFLSISPRQAESFAPNNLHSTSSPVVVCLAWLEQNQRIAISPQGQRLFNLPKELTSFESPTHGALPCLRRRTSASPSGLLCDFGYIDFKTGVFKAVFKQRNISAVQISPDRIIRMIKEENPKFEKDYWDRNQDYPTSRMEMFGRFLKNNNLIGMSEEQVLASLGPGDKSSAANSPNGLVYDLRTYHSLSYTTLLEIFFNGNKQVTSWCFSNHATKSPAVTENVQLDLGRMVSAPAPGGRVQNTLYYPATKPK